MKSSFIKNKPRKECAQFSVHTGPSQQGSRQEGQVWLGGGSQQRTNQHGQGVSKKAKKIKTFSVQLCWLSAINCISACFHKATGKDFVSALPYNTFKRWQRTVHTDQCKVIIHVRRCLLVIMQILPELRSEGEGIEKQEI